MEVTYYACEGEKFQNIAETFMNSATLKKLKPVMGNHFQSDYLWSSSLSC